MEGLKMNESDLNEFISNQLILDSPESLNQVDNFLYNGR